MNDRRLTQLLRMAAEAERMESTTLRFEAPVRASGPAWTGWLEISAAAAAVVVGATVWMTDLTGGSSAGPSLAQSNPTTIEPVGVVPSPLPVAHTDQNVVAQGDPCDSESTVLLAIFRKADGATSTLRFAMKDWDAHRGINDLAEGELIGFAFDHADEITPDTMPDSVVLLAVSGPSDLVPRSDEDAAHLAACLEQAPTTCGEEMPCYANAALQCLPPGVSVHAEARVVR